MRNWVKRKLVWLYESRERFFSLVFLCIYGHRTDQVDNNWRTITQDHETLQIVAGYCRKFEITPPKRVLSRAELHTWSSDEVIDQEVSNMLACGAIVELGSWEEPRFWICSWPVTLGRNLSDLMTGGVCEELRHGWHLRWKAIWKKISMKFLTEELKNWRTYFYSAVDITTKENKNIYIPLLLCKLSINPMKV